MKSRETMSIFPPIFLYQNSSFDIKTTMKGEQDNNDKIQDLRRYIKEAKLNSVVTKS